MKKFLLIALVVCAVAPAVCFGRMRLNAVFHNAAESDVTVYTHYGDVDEVIESGKTGKFVLPTGTELVLGVRGEKFRYVTGWPPEEFWIQGFFSSDVRLLFCENKKIYLVGEDVSFDDLERISEEQPDGWPLEQLGGSTDGIKAREP